MEHLNKNQNTLFPDICQIIDSGKKQATIAVNSALTLTYWHVGKRINEDILNNERAEYGKQVVSLLATQLVERYGKSFESRNLRRMMQFADLFPDYEIVVPLVRQLSWSHFIAIIPLKSHEARMFYAQKASNESWSKRQLRKNIEQKAGENQPIGLILCAEAGAEQVRLLNLKKDGIMVAEYWTELPPKELLEKKLHEALIEAHERLKRKMINDK